MPSDIAPHLADARAYAYLLGLYLGDGHLGAGSQLRFTLDAAYPRIVDECACAMRAVLPSVNVRFRTRTGWRVVIVDAAAVAWRPLFPQHGPGRKHERPIVLAAWQEAIVTCYPDAFLRGLIHSDGCRTINRFKTALPSGRIVEYAYPRYFFTNLSEDIKGLFCAACERLDIEWTRSSEKNISVSRRASVRRLDALVGAKA